MRAFIDFVADVVQQALEVIAGRKASPKKRPVRIPVESSSQPDSRLPPRESSK